MTISVITPTHQRHDLLLRAIRSVEAQRYEGEIEHLVIADGPDPMVRELDGYGGHVRVVELGRNWHSISGGFGAEARMVGTLLARGDLIAYLDDDNVLDPEHVGNLALFLELRRVDFVHSQMRMPDGKTVGSGVVALNQIDTGMVLHRADCLRFGHWQPSGYGSDGELYSRWVEHGATHAHWPAPTYSYRPA